MRDLRGLPDTLVEKIAQHLVATGLLLDDEPERALVHAKAASGLAPRISATREAVGIAAYHAGEYALALVELRAARRMDGSASHLPMMADAERGLGRAERALDYLNDPGVAELDAADRAELLVVVSGARRDLGQPAAAVLLLQDEARRRGAPEPWTPRLWYAYAEALHEAGRVDEAVEWFTSTAAIDEGETDAAERLEELLAEFAAAAPPAVEAVEADDREPVEAAEPAQAAEAAEPVEVADSRVEAVEAVEAAEVVEPVEPAEPADTPVDGVEAVEAQPADEAPAPLQPAFEAPDLEPKDVEYKVAEPQPVALPRFSDG